MSRRVSQRRILSNVLKIPSDCHNSVQHKATRVGVRVYEYITRSNLTRVEMSRSLIDLQNGHPTPCGDLYGTDDDHIIAGNSTVPHPPNRIASGGPGAMLHRHKGIKIEYDVTLKTGSHREKSINYACD